MPRFSVVTPASTVFEKLNQQQQGVSVVIPIKNELNNIEPLWQEIVQTFECLHHWEVIFINDGSTDASLMVLERLKAQHPQRLRILHHAQSRGQSTALFVGIQRAQFSWIATLDGDGQNAPQDLPTLLACALSANPQSPLLIIGHRTQRNDDWLTRFASKIANGVRQRLLNDATTDTGCGIKVFRAQDFLHLPYFDHMHRFLPALFKRAHGQVMSVPVRHRARHSGRSNYGIHNRLWVGIVDLLGVIWLLQRYRLGPVSEVFIQSAQQATQHQTASAPTTQQSSKQTSQQVSQQSSVKTQQNVSEEIQF
jgi:dolichol-phosphate mannosyltransferase